ncbi:MAG: tetratricopeptide repeat protein [Gemmatimonadota bacterium]|nr:tetratricopeptide repeat protein [Gemmatimonadota bacterium]
MATAVPPASAQDGESCADMDRLVEDGWAEYQAGRVSEAERRFSIAAACEPEHIGARVGLGYAALRQGHDARTRGLFEGVLEDSPDQVDAIVGLGLLAWRQGETAEAARLAGRAVELDPGNEEARALHSRTGAALPATTRPVERGPLVLPDTLVYRSRTNGDRFEIRTHDGWRPFYIKGVNLGAALPGRHPSQFPDSTTYATWIDQMSEMGANVVRTYTIHPPAFYQALWQHNSAHPDDPLLLVHGVWTDLPPEHDYEEPVWETAFFTEMRRVVDLLHGRADIEHRPGHASGTYTADVSEWVLAWIIGREWEPYSVIEFNEMRPDLTSWHGRYLTLENGSPMDVWLAKACEEMIAYEVDTYREQRPIAYTNWPTLDPMHHPTETTVAEEVAIREHIGEFVGRVPLEYDNDGAGLFAADVRATEAFPAGYFASYHAYPYYPDFMVLDPDYERASSSLGPSAYFGYLEDLKRAHPDMPVVIAEYGVPTSVGIAHLQPQGWHHGGHTEPAMAEIDARLTREIAEAGLAGGMLFAWIDEWFKKNWIVIDFEIPLERNRMWLNRLDAEQHYGVYAMEAGSALAGETLDERLAAWSVLDPLYVAEDGATLRAHADEAYLTLLYEGPLEATGGGRLVPERLLLGFDMVDPGAGDHRWPEGVGAPLPVGIEFVLDLGAEGARLLVDPPSNPFRLAPVRVGATLPPAEAPVLAPPPGRALAGVDDAAPRETFTDRREQRFNRPYRSQPNADGRYDSLRVVTNRPRFARDTTEYLAAGYDRGVLPHGPGPDGLWETHEDAGAIEIRLPWMLLNVTDPSDRRVLQDLPPEVSRESIGAEPGARWDEAAAGAFGTVTVPDIGIVAAWGTAGSLVVAPAGGERVARFTWDRWDAPRFRARRRPVFHAMQRVFAELDPPVTRIETATAGSDR